MDCFAFSYELTERQRQYIEKRLAEEIPIDIRPLDPEGHMRLAAEEREPRQMYWIKAKGYIGLYAIFNCVTLLSPAILLIWITSAKARTSLSHSLF